MDTRVALRRVGYGTALVGALAAGGIARAGHKPPTDDNGWGGHDRPAYAFVSLTAEGFELENADAIKGNLNKCACAYGSPVLMVNIGTFRAGDSIETTRFEGAGEVLLPQLPEPGTIDEESGWTYDDLEFNQLTLLGSFATDAPDPIVHMMTPYQGAIPSAAQQAFFNASPYLDGFLTGLGDRFPTTFEIAYFVEQHKGDVVVSLNEIQEALFGTSAEPPRVVTPDALFGSALVVADEGTLFPHDPYADGLFRYEFVLNLTAGTLESEACLPIDIDIKPGNSQNSVNLGSEGVLSIAAYTTATFDAATELNPATVTGVMLDERGRPLSYGLAPALRWEYVDVDGDGDLDILFKFDTSELADVAELIPPDEWQAIINFRGRTYAGMTVLSSDTVRVVPPNK